MHALSDFIGIPYVDRGRDMKGSDCWGLACMVMDRVFGKRIPKLDGSYESVEELKGVHQAYVDNKTQFDDINYDDRAPGDLMVFRIRGMPVHVGVVLTQNHMIHTLPGHNSAMERYDSVQWARRIEGVYRWVS